MNTLTTNIIRNVYNIGTNACTSGKQTCVEGYALYFPCLKEITKGQDACFEFYVADYAGRNEYLLNQAAGNGLDDGTGNGDGTGDNGSGKELADLRDVDAISLNLLGAFNCPYGTFSYPDDISSLQTEDYPVVYTDDFGDRTLCHLSVFMLDVENQDSDIPSAESDFYSGTEVEVAAYDTYEKIFIGWALMSVDDDECPDETIYDNIITKDNIYRFTINEDMILLALYRPRKVYTVIVDPNNKFCHFNVNYDHTKHYISNRIEDIFDDGHNSVKDVLEGYHMAVCCVPSVDKRDDSDPDNDFSYTFIQWEDGNTSRCRLFKIGTDTVKFETGNIIKLRAKCDGPFPYEELEDEDIFYKDIFDEEGIHINTPFTNVNRYPFEGDKYTISSNEVYQQYIDEIGYLYFNNGTLVLTSAGIEDGIKVNIYAKADEYCELTVTVNGSSATFPISTEEFKKYEVLFRKCDKSDIEIKAEGTCLVDTIEVCKEEIIDKGKAMLCLDAETTANLPSGPLSVNGAIMVNGQSYGLATTQIGSVNKLPKITITT